MRKFNCLIVEDEPLAAEILEDYIQQVPFLVLAAKCTDAVYALEFLQKQNIDLIFLDINLPKLKGFDFIKSLESPPKIIITSAYREYALEGYELNVLDYLLKPVEFKRFIMAVNKLRDSSGAADMPAVGSLPTERAYLFFNVGKKKIKLFIDEILFIESLKEYVKIHTPTKSIVTKSQLGQLEDLLQKHNFIRVHRSFLVAKDKIDAISATDVEINGQLIPIGGNYKETVVNISGEKGSGT